MHFFFALFALIAPVLGAPLSETWQTGYEGHDASGAHVLGYWRFDPQDPLSDSSGNKHFLSLAGAKLSPSGRFGGALESFAGWPVEDKRHAAFIQTGNPGLSPKGAFTLELWMKPASDMKTELSPVLVDKKYAGHTDYQWRLTTADKSGARRLQASLGFGNESVNFFSEPFVPGEAWQHVAFTYDGAGEVRFHRNGAPIGSFRKPGVTSVTPGRQPFSIGDRVGSLYAGFPGLIDEVRLCDGILEFRTLALGFVSERKVWRRMEKAEPVGVAVRNLTKRPVEGIKVEISLLPGRTIEIGKLAAGAAYRIEAPIDTSLRPATYTLTARVEAPGFASEERMEYILVSRPVPRMPVVMWGIGGHHVQDEMARLKDLGFTHCLGGSVDYGAIWAAKMPCSPAKTEAVAATKATLDFALANDFGIAFQLSPGGWLKDRPEFQRVDRAGKPYSARPDVNAALPGLAAFCENVGASIAQAYRAFPAWQAALVNTEVRDSSQISFSEFDREAYRQYSGAGIPPEVMLKSGVDWRKLKDFPPDRVIPDEHPVRKFYQWFWTIGDGWNGLHTAVHRGIHSTGRDDVWTWFDPAIRAPSIAGSGGEVDVLGQWTYTTPDPLRIGYFTDELLAMAAPRHQRVMKMTQLFWYRTQSAPKKKGAVEISSPFDDHDPDAAYITISPMHLRESFWTKLARPVQGIMYHGWQALVPTQSTSGYRYTHPDTKEEFRRLHREVLEPLGPALLQVGDRASDVAYMDSFTAQMFARRGSYGYSGDETYLTLLYAQLQPQVVHEDAPLDGFKVLVLADCDVLPMSTAKRIADFKRRGGIVVADENVAPAIKPDIRMSKFLRTRKAGVDHAALLANAEKLRAQLDPKYARFGDSSNPEVILRCRESGEATYAFVANDRREAGEYVGQHGLVLENGLPAQAELSLRRNGHVYDLVAGRAVPAEMRDGILRWPVSLGPCDGRVFLVTPKAIAGVRIDAQATVQRGSAATLKIAVADDSGSAIPAVIPLQVEIADPAGRIAEFSGYHAAKLGVLELPLQFARNDAAGVWSVRVQELASGGEECHFFRVTP